MSKKQTHNLWKKAAKILEEQPAPQDEQADSKKEAPKKPRSGLSETRKRALISYMAILFAVAFLLVAFSLILQHKDSQNTISQLDASADSAIAKANQLQEENRLLQQDLADANDQLETAQADLDAAQEALWALEGETADIFTENDALLQEKLDAETRAMAYQLLSRGQTALARGDYNALDAILIELNDNVLWLDTPDLVVYRELLDAAAQENP